MIRVSLMEEVEVEVEVGCFLWVLLAIFRGAADMRLRQYDRLEEGEEEDLVEYPRWELGPCVRGEKRRLLRMLRRG